MKKQTILILLSILSLTSYAQVGFEKGYFINNEGEKIECLIKNKDQRNNPDGFKYKLSENSEAITVSIKSVQEFEIFNNFKYKRIKVKIDRSSEKVATLSKHRDPDFIEEELFLRVLVYGKASLYNYKDGNLNRYFYQIEGSDVSQLIYKSYSSDGYDILKNNTYMQQLKNNMQCGKTSSVNYEKIRYNKSDLIRFFNNYNLCNGKDISNTEIKSKRKVLTLNIRPGLNISSLSVVNNTKPYYRIEADFGTETSFRVGLEAEFVMPFNKGKWALFLEPTYQYFKSEIDIISEIGPETISVDYKSVELPLGVRYYMFLNERSSMFLNASIVFDFPIDSEIVFEESLNHEPEIGSPIALSFGLGYNYNRKYSMEFRYLYNRDILAKHNFDLPSEFNSLSIIFGYTLF